MNWDECKERGIVKEKNKDDQQAKSLLASSKKKFISYKQLDINEDTASSKVGLTYDSLRIVLEALSVEKGFKIYNPECLTCFLNEVLGEKDFSETFDKYRIIRNGFNYYGEEVSIKDAKVMADEICDLRMKILEKYFGETK